MTSIENAAEPEAWFKLERDVFKAGRRLDHRRKRPAGPGIAHAWTPGAGQAIAIDASKIARLDQHRRLAAAAHPPRAGSGRAQGQPASPCRSATAAAEKSRPGTTRPSPGSARGPRMSAWRYRLYRIGKATVQAGQQGWRMLGYLGRVTVETGEADRRARATICASPPWSTRWRKPASTPCPSSACWPS